MPQENLKITVKNVVIVAGEASGDAHAARLVKELRKLDDSICFRGMGGDNLRKANVDVFIDMTELAVVGIVEVLLKYNMIKGELNKLKQNIADNPPDLLILVDYQEFNQRLAAYAKSIGIKVLFYIGLQVWAWRPKRKRMVAEVATKLLVIFEFEVDVFRPLGIDVEFVGHPLLDEIDPDAPRGKAREALGLDADPPLLAIMPGSRRQSRRASCPPESSW